MYFKYGTFANEEPMAENEDIIEDITDHNSDSPVAVLPPPGVSLSPLPPGEPPEDDTLLDVGVPPEGHRIRVDPDDLTQGKKESDDDFKRRRHEYATAPDPYSPTGRKKSKIYLYDWDVKCIGTKGTMPAPARIKGVPAASDAIREFMILRGIAFAAGYRFRAFPVPGTKKDAGDEGYASNHVPDAVRKRRANEGR